MTVGKKSVTGLKGENDFAGWKASGQSATQVCLLCLMLACSAYVSSLNMFLTNLENLQQTAPFTVAARYKA
jgi:hypothetical protein